MNIAKKIVLLGHFGVGKTSIIRQFVTNEFSSDYKVTIGVHILKREVVVNGENVSRRGRTANAGLTDVRVLSQICALRQSKFLEVCAKQFTYRFVFFV